MPKLKDLINNAVNSVTNAVNNTVNNVQQSVQNAGNSISNAWQGSAAGQAAIHAQDALTEFINHVKDSVGNLTINALVPFKGAMVRALQKRGYPVKKSDSILAVSTLFEKVVIKGVSHFDQENYQRFNHLDAPTASAGGGEGSGSTEMAMQIAQQAAATLGPIAIQQLIKTISDFITNLGQKRANGTELSDEEEQMAKDVDAGIAQLGGSMPSGDTDWRPLFIILGLAAAFIIFLRVTKK